MVHRLAILAVLGVVAGLLGALLVATVPLPGAMALDSPPPAAARSTASAIVLVPVSPRPGDQSPVALPTASPPSATGRWPIALGAFIPGASSNASKIDAYASLVGAMPQIVMWYQKWSGEWSEFAPDTAEAIRTRGAKPMISWEPTAGTTADPQWSLRSIVDGRHDVYVRRWTRDVAAWGHELYVRPMYEMNGWWAPWCAGVNGNSAQLFVAAWRHIVDIARAEGATNIRWVWSPNVDNDGLGVPFGALYPGDDAVDWVALDGFNRGTSWGTSHWVTVNRIFGGSIARLRQFTNKPLMLGETGSSEVGGDKAAWIRTGFADIPKNLPDVRAIVWYDKLETAVGIDWRVNSSTEALAAFREVATSAAFSGTLP